MPRPAPDEPYALPWWLNVVSPEAGRLTQGRSRPGPRPPRQAALRPGVVAPRKRLGPPPAAGLRADRFWVCYGTWTADAQSTPAEILSLLPTTAADILRGRPTTKNETLFGGPRVYRTVSDTCSDLATEDGRRLAAALVAGGWEQEQGSAARLSPRTPRPRIGRRSTCIRALHAARRDRMPGVLVRAEQERSMNARLAVLVSLVMAVTH